MSGEPVLLIALNEEEVELLRAALNVAICEGGSMLKDERAWKSLLARFGEPWDTPLPRIGESSKANPGLNR